MTIVTLDERGREVVHTKGSADVLLPLCSAQDTAAGRGTPRPTSRGAASSTRPSG